MVAAIIVAGGRTLPAATNWRPLDEARNLILLIPDGCPPALPTLARWQKGRALALDPLLCGGVRTHAANSLVTDSAAAATALATGTKTALGHIGISAGMPDARYGNTGDKRLEPLPTLLEAAQASGRSVGLVVTCSVGDATPAAFAGHSISRKAEAELVEQLVHQDLDVVLGGGKEWLLPEDRGGRRGDRADLLAVLKERGYAVVETADALAGIAAGRVWGCFASDALAPVQDRPSIAPQQPTLAAMTAKAIQLLKQDSEGFVLMVEGSQVDWACHANDPAGAVAEFLAFDAAVAEAVRFAAGEGRGRTLLVACPDHETGGLSIGRTVKGYTPLSREQVIGPLAAMQVSSGSLQAKIGQDRSPANIAAHLLAWWDIRLQPAHGDAIAALIGSGLPPAFAVGEVVSRHYTEIGWTGHDHTGTDVPLWAFGGLRPTGVVENSELGRYLAEVLGLDLAACGRERFCDLRESFADAVLDESDPANPVARVGDCRLPLNQDVLFTGDKPQLLDGVTVAVRKRIFVPAAAVEAIRRHGVSRPE